MALIAEQAAGAAVVLLERALGGQGALVVLAVDYELLGLRAAARSRSRSSAAAIAHPVRLAGLVAALRRRRGPRDRTRAAARAHPPGWKIFGRSRR
ncbi:MAG: hypothetical protein R3F20_10655 [Planctomycetota bacterium]